MGIVKTLSVGEFKAQFSEALDLVRAGKPVGVSFGKKKEIVAVLAPPGSFSPKTGLKLGLLAGKVHFKVKPGFKLTEAELLSS